MHCFGEPEGRYSKTHRNVKETNATMNIYEIFYFLFKTFVKVELSYVFTINLLTIAETACKSEVSYKNRCSSLVGNYLRPSNNYRELIYNINAVVLILIIC